MSQYLNRNRRIIVLIALFLIIGAAVGVLLPNRIGRFPPIAPGMYVGTIRGIGSDTDVEYPLYVERLPQSNVFIIVAFLEGLRPQAVMAEPLSTDGEPAFQAIPYLVGDRALTLRGEAVENVAYGDVYEGKQKRGTWELKPKKAEEIVVASPTGEDPKLLREWLQLKNDQRRYRREVRGLESELRSEQDKRRRLEGFVRDEKLLQRRAAVRRDELAAQLREAVEQRKKVAAELRELTKELDTFSSITRTGQAVTVARRVAHRENQWYVANWDEAGSTPIIDGSLGIGSQIDYQKLEQQVRKANEVQAMLQELASERAKGEFMRKKLRGEVDTTAPVVDEGEEQLPEAPSVLKPEEVVPARPVPTQVPSAQEPKSLWDRIF